ncbi:MAG: threonine synthase [Chloroflexi bacterium]|nr:threonine synthase [Chloroflexota bacterium]
MTPSFSALGHVIGARCMVCGKMHDLNAAPYLCPEHPELAPGRAEASGLPYATLDIAYDYEAIAAQTSPAAIAADPDRSIGRYHALLPLARRESLPALAVGDTPLAPAPRLAKAVGLKRVWVKDDGRNPTASLKDRASAVVVARARELGVTTVATASTGNAAAALAGQVAAWPEGRAVIFVPETAPQAKIAQLLIYGAQVLAVRGGYDDAFDLCITASNVFGWYNRNTGYNPFTSEGKKTVSFEICEALAKQERSGETGVWLAPDVILVPVGDGSIIGGVYKGLHDALALGWIERMPRIIGVQSERSNALARAWANGFERVSRIQAATLADSISVDWPRDARKAMRAVRESGGAFIEISDEAILEAMQRLAQTTGVFAEPAAAAATAGLFAAADARLISPDERVVVINTGNGLKDVANAMKAAERAGARAQAIEPNLDDVRRALGNA